MAITLNGTTGTVTPGLFSNSTFTGTFTDGVVVDYTTGLGRISVGPSDGLAFYNGGVGSTEVARFDASGNFGIGTSSPTAKLDVATSINLGANYLNVAYNVGSGSGWLGGYNATYSSGAPGVSGSYFQGAFLRSP